MPLPPESLIIAALIVAGAFVIFGITGFGSTIVAASGVARAGVTSTAWERAGDRTKTPRRTSRTAY